MSYSTQYPTRLRLHSGFAGEATDLDLLRREAQRLRAAPGGRLGFMTAEVLQPSEQWLGAPPVVYEESVLASRESYEFRGLGRDDDGNLQIRWFRARMGMEPENITSGVNTRAGLPLGWQHDVGWLDSPCPVGRVLTLGVNADGLVGDVQVSPAQLAVFVADSVDALDTLCSGLSIGFMATGKPALERNAGTREDPDRITYTHYEVFETSLVPIPALSRAGLGKRARQEGSDDGRTEQPA